MSTCLDELTAPLGAMEFLTQVYGRTFHVFPGDPDRFVRLFGWADLNEILATRRLGESQLRLLRGSSIVPQYEYTTKETTKGNDWQRLCPQRMNAYLSSGGTLRLREVDELHRGVGALATALELELRDRVGVNAYANCGVAESYAVHHDDHDVFVLQVAGTKRWWLYDLAAPLPLPDDVDHPTVTRATPPAEAIAELLLKEGQVLYLPRGWRHAAQAVEGPSLHLTVGITRATGVDLLNWLVGRLRNHDVVRADAPRQDGKAARQEYLAEIRELIATKLAEPDVLTQMLADRDARHRMNLGFALPLAGSGVPAPLSGEPFKIRLLARRAVLERDGHALVLRAGGHVHRAGAHLAPILESLAAGRVMTISEMTATCGDLAEKAEINTLVATLIINGLAEALP
jgi:ribosomal protein L16 Arg81 hydroxylase